MKQRFASVEVQTFPVAATADELTSVVRVVANDADVRTAIRAVLHAAGFAVEFGTAVPSGLRNDPLQRISPKNVIVAARPGASVDAERGAVDTSKPLYCSAAAQVPADGHRDATRRIASLTDRQRQILDLVLIGKPSKNIAADLGISQRTVENHRAQIMRKTGCKSLPLLVQVALSAAGRFPEPANDETKIGRPEAMSR